MKVSESDLLREEGLPQSRAMAGPKISKRGGHDTLKHPERDRGAQKSTHQTLFTEIENQLQQTQNVLNK